MSSLLGGGGRDSVMQLNLNGDTEAENEFVLLEQRPGHVLKNHRGGAHNQLVDAALYFYRSCFVCIIAPSGN